MVEKQEIDVQESVYDGHTLEELNKGYQKNMFPGMYEALSSELGGLSIEAIKSVGWGFAPCVYFDQGCSSQGWWTYPEHSKHGTLVNIGLRMREMHRKPDSRNVYMHPGGKGRGFVRPEHIKMYNPHCFVPFDDFVVVTKENCCPICEKPDWCRVSPEDPSDPDYCLCNRESEGCIKEIESSEGTCFLYNLKNKDAPKFQCESNLYLIVEGATDATAGSQLGIPTVGRATAKQTRGLDDLLRGQQAIIVGENDQKKDGKWPGREGMVSVFHKIRFSCSQATMVFPPSEYKDLREWITKENFNQEYFLNYVKKNKYGEEHVEPIKGSAERFNTGYSEFPIDLLPKILADYVKGLAEQTGFDSSFVSLSLLVTVASAIGMSHILEEAYGEKAPCILWGILIGWSGSGKSPIWEEVNQFIFERDKKLEIENKKNHAINNNRKAQYKLLKTEYDKEFRAYIKELRDIGEIVDDVDNIQFRDPPTYPSLLAKKRNFVSDPTYESIMPILSENPRGLVLTKDEIQGWFGGFDKYTRKTSLPTDNSGWLECYGGRPDRIDRKTDNTQIRIAAKAVSVLGGIQPELLQLVLDKHKRSSGLAARLLMVWPDRKIVYKKDRKKIDEKIRNEVRNLFEWLYDLPFMTDSAGDPSPAKLTLSKPAQKAFDEFQDEYSLLIHRSFGDENAAFSKLKSLPLRFAIIFHLVKCYEKKMITDTVSLDTINSAIELTRWFTNETLRVYYLLDRKHEYFVKQLIANYIKEEGGVATVKNIGENLLIFRDKTVLEVEEYLEKMETDNLGHLRTRTTGGRPSREFVLNKEFCNPT